MTRNVNQVHFKFSYFAVTFLAAAGMALAQDQTPPSQPQQQTPPAGGWRRMGDAPPAPAPVQTPADPSAQPQQQQPQPQQDPSQPVDRTDAYGQPLPGAPQDGAVIQQAPPQDGAVQQAPPQGAPGTMQQMPPQAGAPNRPAYGIPAQVTLQQGTYVTVRTNQALSSDHNLVGDTFTATLMQPVVVNGIVVAQRGQLVYGRVSEVQKAHSDKPSRLGLQLTGLTLADGSQVPVQSTLANRQGPQTPGGIQAGTVAGTTAIGAGVGAAVGWGTGAAIGAGAGAMVGLAGVLLTRHHATVLYPETALTFQISSPVTIDTGKTPQAFHYVGPNDYSGPGARMTQLQPRPPGGPGPYGAPYGAAPYGAYYGGYAPYAYAPYGYGYPYPYYPYYPFYGGYGVVVGGRFGGFGRFGGRWR